MTRTHIDLETFKKVYSLKKNNAKPISVAFALEISTQTVNRIYTLIDAAENGEDLNNYYPNGYTNLKQYALSIVQPKTKSIVSDPAVSKADSAETIIRLLESINDKLDSLLKVWN